MDIVYGGRLLERTQWHIQRVQNACPRFCFKIPPHMLVTSYYINKGNILKMKARRDVHQATLLFGVIKYGAPLYLAAKLV